MISPDYDQPVGFIISAEQNLGKVYKYKMLMTVKL